MCVFQNSKDTGELDDCQVSNALALRQNPSTSSRRAVANLIDASVTADKICHRGYQFPSMQVRCFNLLHTMFK
jgi:hypothetical protein